MSSPLKRLAIAPSAATATAHPTSTAIGVPQSSSTTSHTVQAATEFRAVQCSSNGRISEKFPEVGFPFIAALNWDRRHLDVTIAALTSPALAMRRPLGERCAALLPLLVLLLTTEVVGQQQQQRANPRGWQAAREAEERRSATAAAAAATAAANVDAGWGGGSVGGLPASDPRQACRLDARSHAFVESLEGLAMCVAAAFLVGAACGMLLLHSWLRHRLRAPLKPAAALQQVKHLARADQQPNTLPNTVVAGDSSFGGGGGMECVATAAHTAVVAAAVQELVLAGSASSAAAEGSGGCDSALAGPSAQGMQGDGGGSGSLLVTFTAEAAAGASTSTTTTVAAAAASSAAGVGCGSDVDADAVAAAAAMAGSEGTGAPPVSPTASSPPPLLEELLGHRDRADIAAAGQLVLTMCRSLGVVPAQLSSGERLQLIYTMLQAWQAQQARRHGEEMSRWVVMCGAVRWSVVWRMTDLLIDCATRLTD